VGLGSKRSRATGKERYGSGKKREKNCVNRGRCFEKNPLTVGFATEKGGPGSRTWVTIRMGKATKKRFRDTLDNIERGEPRTEWDGKRKKNQF